MFEIISTPRYLVAKYGKWNDRACAVKSLVNEKQLFHCSVRKPNQVNASFVRYVLKCAVVQDARVCHGLMGVRV